MYKLVVTPNFIYFEEQSQSIHLGLLHHRPSFSPLLVEESEHFNQNILRLNFTLLRFLLFF